MDVDLVRHALTVARDRGYAEVELSGASGAFSARLEPLAQAAQPAAANQAAAEPQLAEIKSLLVGYYRPAREPLAIGRMVQRGEIVAIVAALGIANDVESKVTGEVVEILVAPDEPVEYGQVLARVKST